MSRIIRIFLILQLFFAPCIFAGDVPEGKDYPSISRFKGSVIKFYKETKWGSYRLPVSKKGKIDWEKPKLLEGKVTRIQYTVSNANNPEFVMHNYKAGFKKSGYNIMIAIADHQLGFNGRPHTWNAKFYDAGGYWKGLNNGKFGIGIGFPTWQKKRSFIVARGSEAKRDIYAIVYAIIDGKNTLITQDVIEVKNVETGFVSMDNISSDITKRGHIAIYGILFDSGKSVIKKGSEKSLKTVADFMNKNRGKKYYIVGHTDNAGKFDANMVLSRDRARSVMNALIKRYGVKASQLKAYGVASLVPVFSNRTAEGMTENRRVEIVEQ